MLCKWLVPTTATGIRAHALQQLVGHLEVLQWAHADNCAWDSRTCNTAAAGGHFEVLQWLRANGCDWSEDTCKAAYDGEYLEVLQWARDNGCPEPSTYSDSDY